MTVRVVIPVGEAQPPAAHTQGSSGSEQADDYRSVVVVLNDHWRVIVCGAGIQWILQRRRGRTEGQPRWDGRSFCRTRSGLLDSIRQHCGAVDSRGLSIIAQLPDWIDN